MNTPTLPVIIDDDDKVAFLFVSGDSLTVHWHDAFAVIEVHSDGRCLPTGDPLVGPPDCSPHTVTEFAVHLLSAAADSSPVLDEIGVEFPAELTQWATNHADALLSLSTYLREVWS